MREIEASGLLTILLTDVEGSTQLRTRHGDVRADELMRVHDELIRSALLRHSGEEIKTLGDGFLIAFSSPRRAIECAVAIQRGVEAALPLGVRIGLNAGEVRRAGGDVAGETVNAAARIASKANGGEILVSEVVRQLVGTMPGVSFRDRGRVALKGFPERRRLYSVEWRPEESPRPGTLVGRERELHQARSALDKGSAGAGSTTMLEGEAGIGKTRLLDEIVVEAFARGFQVFRGGADEIERDRPFGAIADALDLPAERDDARVEIARLLADARVAAGDLSYHIVEAIATFVEDVAARRPVLVALEDVHWADVATLRVVRALARVAPQLPLVVVVTLRPTPRLPEMDRVIDALLEAGNSRIELTPLDEGAVELLAARTASAPPGPRLRALVAGAAGNPLFVTELIRALEDEGSIRITNGHAEAETDTLPPNLRLTILRRLSFMPPETLEMLKLAAILGSSFSLGDLALLAGREVVEITGMLDEALRAGLVGAAGERLRFRHDLIRESIEEDMPLAVRKALHREAARALIAAGAPAGRVAEHMTLGAETGDREAVIWLCRAADEATHRSPAIAVQLLERALELTDRDDPDRAAIVAEMLEPLVWAGEALRAEQLARSVLTSGLDPAVEIGLRSGLAGVLAFLGQLLTCAEELERGAALEGAPARIRARLAAGAASIRAIFGGEQAKRAAEAALDQGRQVGSPYAEAVALQTLAVIAAAEGRTQEGVGLAEKALAAARHMGPEEGRWEPFLIPHFWLGMFLLVVDRFDEAGEIAASGILHDEEAGVTVHLVQWVPTFRRLATGDWDDAVAEMEAWIGLAEETGVGIGVGPARAMLAFVALHRDEVAMAETAVAQGEAELTRVGLQYAMELVPWVRALVLEAQGDTTAAAGMLGPIWDALEPIRRLTIAHTMIDADLVRLALAANDQDTARRVTSQLEEVARLSDVAGVRGAALRCRAMVEQDPAVAVEAVMAFRHSPRTLETAFACEEAAALLSGSDARDFLEEAFGIYERIGATRDLARAGAAMRARGVRRRVARRTRATVGWEALTRTELEVVRLAAGGLTNRQIGERLFISRRTAETHLGHVFQKLGISTRVELAAAAARRLA